MPTSELHDLSQRIDKVALEFFDVLDKYYEYQAMLEQNLKSGNLHMSRARYIRGVTSISSLKITEREMRASAQVECSGTGLETTLSLVTGTSSGEGNENDNDDGTSARTALTPSTRDAVRKRNVTKVRDENNDSKNSDDDDGNDDGDDDSKGSVGGIETDEVTTTKSSCGSGSGSGAGKDKKSPRPISKDPLNWFGVLVPQSLRYSQKNYKSAIKASVELANLQLRIQSLQVQYQQLLQQKNILALAEVKVSTPAPAPPASSLSSSSS